MKRFRQWTFWIVAACFAVALNGEQAPATPASVDLSGTISKVSVARCAGPPTIEVTAKSGQETKTYTVFLGPMRDLLAQNFSPKAGQEVTIKGFQGAGENQVIANTVTLKDTNQTLQIRRGPPAGGPRGMGPGGGRGRGYGRGPRCQNQD